MTAEQLWKAVLGELELKLSRPNYTTWFKNTFISEYDGKLVVIGVPSAFTKSWLEQKYHKVIVEALQNITSNQVQRVVYKVESAKGAQSKRLEVIKKFGFRNLALNSTAAEATTDTPENRVQVSRLNPKYVFDTFVVGAANELANAAAQAVVGNPGMKYNPLFLYGGVGLGKTHLTQAIGNAILDRDPSAKVIYVNFERFTNDFVEAARRGGFDQFRDKYRTVDVLLMDDIQFMIRKDKIQDEFFHTFESLHQMNKQLIVTSDRPPKALAPLQDRLISRFEWGMIADFDPPDEETRLAILNAKCEDRNFEIADDIKEYLVKMIHTNVRELEGALNKIIAWNQLNQVKPTLEVVKKILANLLINPNKGALTLRQILEVVAEFYEIEVQLLLGTSRKKNLVGPRQVAMFLMRQEMKSSFPTIGSEFGRRDHTTAMHACAKIEQEIEKNDLLRHEVLSLRQRLYS